MNSTTTKKCVSDVKRSWKKYIDAKGQTQDHMKKFTEKESNFYMDTFEVQAHQEKKMKTHTSSK